jgi:hypothetical protein
MAAEYGHDMAPLSYGQMRAAHADRERAIDVLKAAFAEGRIDQDEYASRVGQVYSSRTYAELGALTADLPAGPLGTFAPPPPPPAPVQYRPPGYPVRSHGRMHPVLAVVLVLLVVGALGDGLLAVAVIPVVLFTMIMIMVIRAWR